MTFALDRADVPARRRRPRDPHRDRRLDRGRRRAAARVDHESRTETRTLDLTSYAEVVLAPPDADIAHPAFSNLFVETSALPERDALLCARRPRAGGEPDLPAPHAERPRPRRPGHAVGDQPRPLHRPRPHARDIAGDDQRRAALEHDRGRCSIRSCRCASSCGCRRAEPLGLRSSPGSRSPRRRRRGLAEKYHDRRAVARALALAGTHSQIELRHFGLTVEDTIRFQRLGGRLLYGDPRLRAADAVQANRRSQPELWKYGISGDLPMLLAQVRRGRRAPVVPRAAEGPRVPARQGPDVRSRGPERARRQLPAGSPRSAGGGASEQSRARLGGQAWRRIPAARRPDAARGSDAAQGHGARGHGRLAGRRLRSSWFARCRRSSQCRRRSRRWSSRSACSHASSP